MLHPAACFVVSFIYTPPRIAQFSRHLVVEDDAGGMEISMTERQLHSSPIRKPLPLSRGDASTQLTRTACSAMVSAFAKVLLC